MRASKPPIGDVIEIKRILAPNPGTFTGPGTNTYLIQAGPKVLVVDPGPVIPAHMDQILSEVEGLVTVGVVVTHTHPDHAPLANPLARELEVPAIGHSEGPDFDPDQHLVDGDILPIGFAKLEVLYTPGHASDHLCFLVDNILFTGDHIMGGSTVLVEDMAAYMASLYRLQKMALRRLMPGHGPSMDNPIAVIDEYIAHRLEREQQIVEAIQWGAGSVGQVVTEVYADVDRALHPLAAHSVAAHLRKLQAEGIVSFADDGSDLWSAIVSLLRAHDA